MIHLTMRAVEFLNNAGKTPAEYKSTIGKTACKKKRKHGDDWCRVEDVRALLRGDKRVKGRWLDREARLPTCPTCAVLLDNLFSKI